MNNKLLRSILPLVVLGAASGAEAALIDRGGGLIYDDVLDVTWLQDANYFRSTLPGTPTEEDSKMTFEEAIAWVSGLEYYDSVRDTTWTDWRLPGVSPINGSTFQIAFRNNATSDEGYARTTTDGSDGAWRDAFGTPVSEMGYMYYVNLGNLGTCTPNDASPSSCVLQPGRGLINTGPFTNLTKEFNPIPYWTATTYGATQAWYLNFSAGFQGRGDTEAASSGVDFHYVWAVRDGDVAVQVVPLPAAAWLFGAALGVLGWARRQRD